MSELVFGGSFSVRLNSTVPISAFRKPIDNDDTRAFTVGFLPSSSQNPDR